MECVGRVNTPNTAQGLGDKRDALGAQPCPFCTWAAQFLWFGFFFFFFLKGSATAAVVSTRHRTVAFLMHQFHWFFLCSTWLSLREEPLSFYIFILLVSVQFSPQSCPTLCDPMDCSVPGLPVHHQRPELAQTHVHWIGVAIQLSYPLLSSSPAFSLPASGSFLMSWIFISSVAQSCPTPWDPMDCSTPGSSVHGIFQARVLEWGAIAFSENVSFMFINLKEE